MVNKNKIMFFIYFDLYYKDFKSKLFQNVWIVLLKTSYISFDTLYNNDSTILKKKETVSITFFWYKQRVLKQFP